MNDRESGDPREIVSALESKARRHQTPCGEGRLVWHEWGSGVPLVLFHGAHGSWSHWIRNIPYLAETRRVLVADLPGYGDSSDAPEDTPGAICAVLAEGLEQLVGGDTPLDIVGFSFGGFMGTYLSVFYPHLVRRLVLVGTGGLGTPGGAVNLTRVKGLEGEERRSAHRHNLLNLMLRHDDSVDELALYLQELNGMRGRLNPSNLVLPDKLLDGVKQTKVQLDAMWGELDLPHPDPEVQERVLRQFQPNLEFRVIPEAGHWAMFERPDAFNKAVGELLDTPLRSVL